MRKISAVLITREEVYPPLVLERLDVNFFDEILIETKAPNIAARYKLASSARNETIYVQDDDCFVNFQVLYRSYDEKITSSITSGFKRYYDGMGCSLVGWGAFFDKSALRALGRYLDAYGEDQHFLREADRIFTYLNKPYNQIIMPHENLFQEQGGRMHQEAIHFPSAEEAIKKCQALT